ncbi:glycosyl hydrolase [Pelagicoccus sp. SDUM812003]|uniref:glycoside hydrolase family 26 protein n=1 Tax=Pelagicoccus sp. SDUM812003 TaxID=3041267 RepID=UPI00280D7B16|nr:glycosyl hydrolase [Pelagicoccus sp. SDUM812003]MDQ8204966.1 glycosyl hydrolase [Pelagicoccus sp. SDUM812003]
MLRFPTLLIPFAALFFAACSQSERSDDSRATPPRPVDPTLSEETRALFRNLHRIGWDPDKIIFGQEFPLTFNRAQSFNTDIEQSDCKDLVGDHPGVHGSDFHFLMPHNVAEKPYHIAAVKKAYREGAIITFDFHWSGKYGGDYHYTERDGELLYNVTRGDDSEGDVTWFYQTLDQVLAMINHDIGVPIVFRPFHEMNGDWFWWGRNLKGGPETYRRAYQLLVDYIRDRSELVLFCWSPDKGLAAEYYPGNEYVDIIGMDIYDTGSVEWASVEQMVGWLEDAVDFALENGKVAAFTETGNRVDYPEGKPDWWMRQTLEPILASEKARHIAWMLTWINAPWSKAYVPASDSPHEAKESFRSFYEHPVTLFQSEVAAELVYQ